MKTIRLGAPVLGLVCLAVSACTGGDDDGGPAGEHHHYVLDSVTVPLDAQQGEDLGKDLDGDGTVDNQFANVLSALVSAAGGGLDFSGEANEAVFDGSVLLLADLQTTDLASATDAAFSIYSGANPSPAPCTNPDDPLTCGMHLSGSGTFAVEAGSDTDATVTGNVVGGTLEADGGDLLMSVSLFGTVVDFRLIEARAHVTGIALNGSSLGAIVIAGAIPEAAVETEILPAIHGGIAAAIAADCTAPTLPDCGCQAGSTGETLLGIFDDNMDCAVPLAEFQANSIITTLFRPDVDTDGDDVADALSFGVGVSAVKGTFTQPTVE